VDETPVREKKADEFDPSRAMDDIDQRLSTLQNFLRASKQTMQGPR